MVHNGLNILRKKIAKKPKPGAELVLHNYQKSNLKAISPNKWMTPWYSNESILPPLTPTPFYKKKHTHQVCICQVLILWWIEGCSLPKTIAITCGFRRLGMLPVCGALGSPTEQTDRFSNTAFNINLYKRQKKNKTQKLIQLEENCLIG